MQRTDHSCQGSVKHAEGRKEGREVRSQGRRRIKSEKVDIPRHSLPHPRNFIRRTRKFHNDLSWKIVAKLSRGKLNMCELRGISEGTENEVTPRPVSQMLIVIGSRSSFSPKCLQGDHSHLSQPPVDTKTKWKQKLCFSTWASNYNRTFVLMSTGGWVRREWSPCTHDALRNFSYCVILSAAPETARRLDARSLVSLSPIFRSFGESFDFFSPNPLESWLAVVSCKTCSFYRDGLKRTCFAKH